MLELVFHDLGVTLLRASDEKEHQGTPEKFITNPAVRKCNGLAMEHIAQSINWTHLFVVGYVWNGTDNLCSPIKSRHSWSRYSSTG